MVDDCGQTLMAPILQGVGERESASVKEHVCVCLSVSVGVRERVCVYEKGRVSESE